LENPIENRSKPRLNLSIQKVIGHIYFSFNSLGLKGGLLYTHILTPLFLLWLYKEKYLKHLTYACLCILPFSIFHYFNGVQTKSFLISHLLFVSTIIFIFSAYHYINFYASLKKLLHQILIVNFILVMIAIPFYFMEYQYQSWFWYTNLFTTQNLFTRLSLFTFEASYYALTLVPITVYYFFKHAFNNQLYKGRFELMMAVLPLILSLSYGVIGALIITACLMVSLFYKSLSKHPKHFLILNSSVIAIFFIGVISLIFFPDNLVILRIQNIFMGADTSTNGRTFESFGIAWKVAKLQNIWWGCGLGQVKLLMPSIIKQFYSHWGIDHVNRIPNAVAETLATFGIFGVLFRFTLIFYFFFKTKVFGNYFRLSLFIFIFIYQFSGSYIVNVVEYIIWIIAFSAAFPEFDWQKQESLYG
jgi:hypothetical protein